MKQHTQPLVSVIVPTYNSAAFLEACLQSIKDQTYKNIELIVVDNNSTDTTKAIAKQFTDKVYNKGPERSAQVNYGVRKAAGEFVYKVDSDFILEAKVVEECVTKASEGYGAVVVHNSPDETISWIARIRKFEVDMYKYDLLHSSARFVMKSVYQQIGGFNELITAGEDYDFQNKLNRAGVKTGFINAEALHKGEPTSFWRHMKKYYAYGKDFVNYREANTTEAGAQLRFGRAVYYKNWKRFVSHPLLAFLFLLYNLSKYFFGGLGFLKSEHEMKKLSKRASLHCPPNSDAMHFKYFIYDQVKFYGKYLWLKIIKLWFEVKTPKLKFFVSEMVYSGSKLIGIDMSSKKMYGLTYAHTVFGKYFFRPVLLDAICVSPAFERPDLDKCLDVIKKIRTEGKKVCFVDIGADLGTYSIAVGNRFYADEDVKIIAFEPAKESLQLLRKNISANGLSAKITTHNVALGESDAHINLNYNALTPGSSGVLSNAIHTNTSYERVSVKRMDTVLRGEKNAVAVIKIDVEGYEEKVLRGAEMVLPSYGQIFLLVEDFVDQSIIKFLETEGYSFLAKITPYNSWWTKCAQQ